MLSVQEPRGVGQDACERWGPRGSIQLWLSLLLPIPSLVAGSWSGPGGPKCAPMAQKFLSNRLPVGHELLSSVPDHLQLLICFFFPRPLPNPLLYVIRWDQC